jgi:hypothetical protein
VKIPVARPGDQLLHLCTSGLEGRMNALDRVIEGRDRREPGFAAAVEAELAEIGAIDVVVNIVLERLSELGWTREELAACADLNAASPRRLLTPRPPTRPSPR